MPIDRKESVELSLEEIQKMCPFFGPKSLFVDSFRAEKTINGGIGSKGIGSWVIPDFITKDHFNSFEVDSSRVEDLKLIPGHFWAESLGQALGILVFLKYPTENKLDILPTFDQVTSKYIEAAFPGDKVNLCVELTSPLEERGRIKVIRGRGAAVFNGRVIEVSDPITVNILPANFGVRALQMLRARHLKEGISPRVATFDKFVEYFAK